MRLNEVRLNERLNQARPHQRERQPHAPRASAGNPQFEGESIDVLLYGSRFDVQARADLAIFEPAHEQPAHFNLTLGNGFNESHGLHQILGNYIVA